MRPSAVRCGSAGAAMSMRITRRASSRSAPGRRLVVSWRISASDLSRNVARPGGDRFKRCDASWRAGRCCRAQRAVAPSGRGARLQRSSPSQSSRCPWRYCSALERRSSGFTRSAVIDASCGLEDVGRGLLVWIGAGCGPAARRISAMPAARARGNEARQLARLRRHRAVRRLYLRPEVAHLEHDSVDRPVRRADRGDGC